MTIAKLLLIDDETAFLDAMARRLQKRDFDILTATSGMEAMEVLSNDSEKIEVVILDVKMPGMDGIETLVEIKRKYPLIEVVMLTGHATVSSAIDGMKQGAFDYLMKPCDMDVLVAKVNEAAAKKRSHEEKIIEARLREITTRHA
ncbi:MAG: response regulator [Desulfobacterales bacterium]|jgi:DNA-binding NtrC family response regulator